MSEPETIPTVVQKPQNVEVYDFTEEKTPTLAAVYTGITPREAVIACYAQSRADFSTWDYGRKYGPLVKTHAHSVSCGRFSALV